MRLKLGGWYEPVTLRTPLGSSIPELQKIQTRGERGRLLGLD